MASTAELAILLTARDMASKEIQGLGASLGKLGGMGKVAAVGLAGIATAGAGLAAGFGASINSAANFQAILSQVGAVSGAVGGELDALSDLALKMGADTSFSASEAAQAMAELAKGGIAVKDMAAVLPGTLDLAAAGGLGLAEAATIATDSMAIFATQGVTMDQVANAFAGAANISSISVQDMAEAMKYAGPVAASMGIKMEDVSAAIALLGANGIKASSAGTGIRTMLTGLAAPTAKARNLMEDLGLEFFDANGKMKDFAGISDTLKSKLKGMSDAQRLATLETLFGKEGMSAAIAIMGEGDNSVKSYTQRLKEAASANATGKKMLDNFSGSMEALKGSVETAAITLGLAFLPALRKIVDGLTGAVNAAVPFVKQYGPVLVAALQQGIGVLMQWGGAVWGAVSAVIGAFAALLAGKTTLAEFIGGMEIFVTTILEKLGGLAAKVAPYIGQFFSALGSAIVTYGPQILAQLGLWLTSLVEWFGSTAVPALATAAGNLASALGGWISGTAIPYLAENLPLWKDAIVTWLTDTAIPEVKAAAGGMVSALGDWIRGEAIPYLAENIPYWIEALRSWIVDGAVPTVIGAVVGLANAMGDWVAGAATYLSEKLPQWGNALYDFITLTAVPTVRGKVVALANAMADWIETQAVPRVNEKMPTWSNAIITFLEGMQEKIQKALEGAGKALGDWVVKGAAALYFNLDVVLVTVAKWIAVMTLLIVVGAFKLTEALGKAFKENPELAQNLDRVLVLIEKWIITSSFLVFILAANIGKAIGNGIIWGVDQIWSAVITKATDLANAVVEIIRKVLDINSPSKRTIPLGRGIVEGLVVGMDQEQQEATKKAAEVASAVAKAVTDTLGAMKALGGLRLSSLPSAGKVGGFLGALGGFFGQFAALGGTFSGGLLDTANKFADAAGKATGVIKNAVDGLTAIGKFTAPLDSAISAFLASLADFMEKFSTVAGGFEVDTLADATAFADAASKVGGAVGNALKGLQELAGADWAKSSPSGSAMGWFTHLVASLVQNFANAALLFADDALARASEFADAAGKVGGAVGNALNGLKALATADWAKSSPSGSAMAWFTHLVASLIENFRNATQMFTDDGLKQAAAFAESAGKVLGIIGGGVQGLLALNTFVAPSKLAIDNFLAAMLYVVQRFGDVAQTLSTEGIAKTTAFADAAAKALGATKTGIDAFVAMKNLTFPSTQAVDALLGAFGYILVQMQALADAVGIEGLQKSQDFADAAGRVFATVKAGLELLNSLKTYKDLPAKAIGELIKAFEGLFENMGQLQTQANAFEQQADTFLGTMQRAAQKIANGLALGGAAPKIGTGLELSPNTGGFSQGGSGGGSGGTVNNITVTGNTLLGDDIVLSQNLANILTPAQSRQVSYSY